MHHKTKNIRPYLCTMFKQITATILFLAFSVQTFSVPFISLDYFVNTAAYAKNCVNKTKPKMHCNGKCQMMKKIQQEEKKEQQNSERRSENKVQVLSSRSFFSILTIPIMPVNPHFSYVTAGNPVGRTKTVFHPPRS